MPSNAIVDSMQSLLLGVLPWLLTYLVHSSLLIATVWLLVKSFPGWSNETRDGLWKVALVGAIVSATIQCGLGLTPFSGRIELASLSYRGQESVSFGEDVVEGDSTDSTGADFRTADRSELEIQDEVTKVPSQFRDNGAYGSRDEAGRDEAGRNEECQADGTQPVPHGTTPRSCLRPTGEDDVSAHDVGADSLLAGGVFETPGRGGRSQTSGLDGEPASSRHFAWPGLSVLLWLVIASIGLARIVWIRSTLSWRLAPRNPIRRGALMRMLSSLCRAAGIRSRIRLTQSPRLSGPIALGRHEICVPRRAVRALEPEQQETMLAHELAHLVRRDPSWLFLARVIEALFFFQPLNRLVRRQMQEVAEYLCDDWAVRRTNRGLSLAKCLAEVAQWIEGSPTPDLASGMADRSSSLVRRVERLLDEERDVRGIQTRWRVPLMSALLIALISLAPAVTAVVLPDAPVVGGPAPSVVVDVDQVAPVPAPSLLLTPTVLDVSPGVVPGPSLLLASPDLSPVLAMVSPVVVTQEPVKLGIFIGDMSQALATHLGVDPDAVILVDKVVDGSLAESVGLKQFDVIVGINGEGSADLAGLKHALVAVSGGDSMTLVYLRKGKRGKVTIDISGGQGAPSQKRKRRVEDRSDGADDSVEGRLEELRRHREGRSGSRRHRERKKERARQRDRHVEHEREHAHHVEIEREHAHHAEIEREHEHAHRAEIEREHARHVERAHEHRAEAERHVRRLAEFTHRRAEHMLRESKKALEQATRQLRKQHEKARSVAEGAYRQAERVYRNAHEVRRHVIEEGRDHADRARDHARHQHEEIFRQIQKEVHGKRRQFEHLHRDAQRAFEHATEQSHRQMDHARRSVEQALRQLHERQERGEVSEDEAEEIEEALYEEFEEFEEGLEEETEEIEEVLEETLEPELVEFADELEEAIEPLMEEFEELMESLAGDGCDGEDEGDWEEVVGPRLVELERRLQSEFHRLEDDAQRRLEHIRPLLSDLESSIHHRMAPLRDQLTQALGENRASEEIAQRMRHAIEPAARELEACLSELQPRMQNLERGIKEKLEPLLRDLKFRLGSHLEPKIRQLEERLREMNHGTRRGERKDRKEKEKEKRTKKKSRQRVDL